METKKNFWKAWTDWFTISRVLITFWNIIAFCYHYFVIGIDSWIMITIQITAIITEYVVSTPYERLLLWSNKKINKKTMNISFPSQFFIVVIGKYIAFTTIFAVIYYTSYYIRLEFFYLIDWGVNSDQLMKTMVNMFWFTIIAGPIMAIIVIERKKKIGSSVGEELFL